MSYAPMAYELDFRGASGFAECFGLAAAGAARMHNDVELTQGARPDVVAADLAHEAVVGGF